MKPSRPECTLLTDQRQCSASCVLYKTQYQILRSKVQILFTVFEDKNMKVFKISSELIQSCAIYACLCSKHIHILLDLHLLMLNLKKSPTLIQEEVKTSQNKLVQFLKVIIPPFFLYIAIHIFAFFHTIIGKVRGISHTKKEEQGQISKEFNRRRYEQHLETLKINQEQLGFTNQVLYQQNKKSINYYLPVFITNKIKSIQDVSVQSLTGNISCAMIINVCFDGLPDEVVDKLEKSIIIQLNRGEAIRLEDDGISITVKRQKSSKFLIFTIRKLFLAFLLEDTLWSPFELVELIISVTLNTVTIHPFSIDKKHQKSDFCPEKQYKISFNCMRNSDTIPISYALDCVFGVYDLAERKLETYHTKYGTISQIQKAYEEYLARQSRKEKEAQEKSKQQEKQRHQKIEKTSEEKQKGQSKQKSSSKQKESSKQGKPEEKKDSQINILQILAHSTMKRLSLKPMNSSKKKQLPKVKYFQYTHFVIPLYKYPGNSLATIFIPIFLLALVSLTIFFQEPELSGRIGAIATMILGYIALIPSIKEQLPPSSKLTVIESVVYIETMCCLLCLYQSFSIDGNEEYKFVWHQNYTFLMCLITHISTFVFVLGLYTYHKLKWEPEYNCDEKVIEIKPGDNRQLWHNPYCDEVFIKFNKNIRSGHFTDKEREQLYIKPLKDKNNPPRQKSKEVKQQRIHIQNQSKVAGIFDQLISIAAKQKSKKQISSQEKHEEQIIEKVAQEFVIPDPNLYFRQSDKFKEI